MRNKYLLLACLGLVLFSGAAFAGTPVPVTPASPAAPHCQMTVAAIAAAVQPVSHQIITDPFSTANGVAPAPIFKSFIGDCCPGNDYHNCPDLKGYGKHCGTPYCETGEFSCLYAPLNP